jgi:hypothetical protein
MKCTCYVSRLSQLFEKVNLSLSIVCDVLLYDYVLSSVLWCPLWFLHRNDFHFIFASGWLWEVSCVFCNVICVCLCIVVSNTYWVVGFFVVFFRLLYPMLPDSLNCPFLIPSLVFSNVYSFKVNILHKLKTWFNEKVKNKSVTTSIWLSILMITRGIQLYCQCF